MRFGNRAEDRFAKFIASMRTIKPTNATQHPCFYPWLNVSVRQNSQQRRIMLKNFVDGIRQVGAKFIPLHLVQEQQNTSLVYVHDLCLRTNWRGRWPFQYTQWMKSTRRKIFQPSRSNPFSPFHSETILRIMVSFKLSPPWKISKIVLPPRRSSKRQNLSKCLPSAPLGSSPEGHEEQHSNGSQLEWRGI